MLDLVLSASHLDEPARRESLRALGSNARAQPIAVETVRK